MALPLRLKHILSKIIRLRALIIKIDFEKAYDRIEWHFIIPFLKTVAFIPFYIKEVQTLFSKAIVCLSSNKAKVWRNRSFRIYLTRMPLGTYMLTPGFAHLQIWRIKDQHIASGWYSKVFPGRAWFELGVVPIEFRYWIGPLMYSRFKDRYCTGFHRIGESHYF
jgi:hypothetical protein